MSALSTVVPPSRYTGPVAPMARLISAMVASGAGDRHVRHAPAVGAEAVAPDALYGLQRADRRVGRLDVADLDVDGPVVVRVAQRLGRAHVVTLVDDGREHAAGGVAAGRRG